MLEIFQSFKSLAQQVPSSVSEIDKFSDSNLHMHVHYKDKNQKYLVRNSRTITDAGLNNQEDLKGMSDFDFKFLTTKQASRIQTNDKAVFTTGRANYFIEPFFLENKKKYIGYDYKSPIRQRGTKGKIVATVSLCLIISLEEMLLSCFTGFESDSINSEQSILSAQQTNCLYYLVKGMTIKQIANTLNLSPRTIEWHLNAVKGKLKVRTRAELIEKGFQLKMIKDRL